MGVAGNGSDLSSEFICGAQPPSCQLRASCISAQQEAGREGGGGGVWVPLCPTAFSDPPGSPRPQPVRELAVQSPPEGAVPSVHSSVRNRMTGRLSPESRAVWQSRGLRKLPPVTQGRGETKRERLRPRRGSSGSRLALDETALTVAVS